MNVAAYCRVSTNKEDQLNSLDTQKRFFEDYTATNNLNLIRIYADEGISGTKLKKRKEFLQMLEDAKNGLFEMILVKDISRFARNTVDSLESLRTLYKYGVKVNFISLSGIDTTSEFLVSILSSVAQVESENISKRVKIGKSLNAKEGKTPNIVYGYDKIQGEIFTLAINEQEANVVRRIFNLYVNEGFGALKISLLLNKEGLKTKRNCKWSQNAVSRILTNELYIGKVINGRSYVHNFLTGERKTRSSEDKDYHEKFKPWLKIIDEEVFYEAQEILKTRHKAFKIDGKRSTNKYVFSTLIKCKHCGYSFRRFERTYVNTFVRWVCSGRNANGMDSCPNATSVDETELLVGVKEQLIILLKDKPNIIKRARKEFERLYDSNDENKKTAKELEADLNKLKRDKQEYINMRLAEVITMSELKEAVKPINERIEHVENELRLVKNNLSKADILEGYIDDVFKSIEEAISVEHLTNGMLKRIFQKIVIDEHGNVEFFLNLRGGVGLPSTVLLSDVVPDGCHLTERLYIVVS